MSNSTTNQLCMIPVQFALLSSISCLLPAIVYATVFYASSVPGSGSGLQKAHQTPAITCTIYTPQLTRFWCAILIFSAHGAVYFWAVFHNHMFRQLQPSSSNVPGMNLLRSTVIQHWYGLFAFSLLAFVLPRNLEYQARLLRQWITKGNEAVQSLSATRLALARLLISAVPRFVVAVLCSPSRACELYSKPYHLVGLVLIQLSVNPDPRAKGCSMNRMAGTPNDPTDKSATTEEGEEEPAQIADRLRLLNHMISLIDGLATTGGGVTKRPKSSRDGGGSLIGKMNDSQLIDSAPSLVKVHVGGATVGYAVGLLPSDTIHDSDSRTEHLTHLLTFTERILEACEEVNSKAKSTNSFIHLRVALHAGPALVGLIGKQRPVFNLWGDPVNVCLHLLHESHVPALNRQHLLLATDDVINAIPCARLNIILKSGQPLVWRCVDTQTGRILLSAQVPASAAPGGPNRSRPCLPLHFCSILATIPEPDVDYANRAAFAMLNLAKRASFKTPQPNTGAGEPRSQKVPTTTPTEQPSNVQQPLRQSAVVSQIQQPLLSDLSPRPVSVVHSIPSKTVGASSNAQPYSRGHSVQSTLVNQSQPPVVPPPPPPHKRHYAQPKHSYAPGGPSIIQPANPDAIQSPRVAIAGPHASHSITEKLCDTSVTNHAYVRASPERKYSEPPATITRQALRRGVVSQCAAAHTHDYSIVNFEPPEPHPARVTSQLLEPRSSTQQAMPHMMSRRGEYWPNIPNKSSETGVPLDLRLKQCRVGHESTEKTKPPIPTPLPRQADRPPTNHLRPVSLSSTDSFLAAERACAAGCDEAVNTNRVTDSSKFVTPNGRSREEEQSGSGTEFVSHHNPLYTDNEYDSMTESQGNLLNPGKRKRTRRASQTTRSSSTHSKKGKLSSEKISLLSTYERNMTAHSSHASSSEKKSESGHINGAIDMPATPKFRVPCTREGLVVSDRNLDFPDIQRPSSPGGYPHCKMGLNKKPNLVPSLVGYGSGNYVGGNQPCNTGPSSSSTSSAARSAPGNTGYGGVKCESSIDNSNAHPGTEKNLKLWPDDCFQSDRIALTKAPQMHPKTNQPETAPSEFHGQSPKDTGSPLASDVDGIDGEYAGTYSLGPLSMAVQPSIADDGITSCDGDFGDYEDDEDPHGEVEDQSVAPESMSSGYTRPLIYPGWSQQRSLTTNQFNLDLPMAGHLPQSCMTDSLLANPDLDARESELADELEPSRLNSPDEPIDPRQAPSLLEAAFVPLSLPHECICESDGDEMFAYHNRPGVFHINPYSVQGHSRLVPSELQHQHIKPSVTPAKNERVAGGYFPPGPQFISEHSIQLQCSSRPGKPSLPEIAPVSLPNFTRQLTSPVSDEVGQSDYDNLSHPNASLLKNHSSSNGRSSQKLLDKYHWQRPPPDDGTATVSCYAASSVYDTGDDADVDDDYKQREIFKPVLSPCSLSTQPNMNVMVPTVIPNGAANPGSPQMSMSGVNPHTNGQVQSPNPCGLPPVIDGVKPGQSTDKTAIVNFDRLLTTKGLNRTPSAAASQTSSVDQQSSEYDNVDRSSVSVLHSETSDSPIIPNGTPSLHDNRPSRVGSTGKVPSERHLRGGVRAMFDAEIAAEAQRISRQFRAMGWIPASDYVQSFGDANGVVADELLTENLHFPDAKHSQPRPKSPVRDSPRPHLFLLPLDPQRSTPCSRQTSFRNRHRRGLASAADSETVTSVTSQLDDDDFDEDYGAQTDASDFEEINETVHYTEDCSKLNSGAWVSDSYPDRELGCLMIRPRSLSATCLNDSAPAGDALAGLLLASDLSEVSSDEKDGMMSDPETGDLHQKSYLDDHHNAQRSAAPSARLCDRQRKAVRRVKSSRTSQRPSDINEDNAGFARLKRRAARVRSLLPPDLQPFVLPGCMSSLSRSSSVASSVGLHHLKTGLVFLSLSRRQPSGKRHRKRRCRLPRCSSDPELRIKAIKGCS